MKRSMFFALFLIGLGIASLPFALLAADSGKDRIFIREEVLAGDPAEAEGITLKLPSHWQNRLFWDTEYTVGGGEETKSSFAFSSRPLSWEGAEKEVTAGIRFALNSFTSLYGDGYVPLDYGGNELYREMVNGVAERTESGEMHTEILRLGDYSPSCPMEFGIEGHSVIYAGDYGEECGYLSEYFHISPAEDKVEITVEKNAQGEIRSVSARFPEGGEDVSIKNAAADGGDGLYFVYAPVNTETEKWADRGQNSGIFYFPYQEDDGLWNVKPSEVRKLCDFPEHAVPLQMLADREKGRLYLAVEEESAYSLYVYRLEGEIPVLSQQIPAEHVPAEESELPFLSCPSFCRMVIADGGILMTWEDNSFAFFGEDKGQYRLQCGGVFPISTEKDYGGNPFPQEQVCISDGERLILAAYESRYGMNVLLSVYEEQELVYAGRYVHSNEEDVDDGYDILGRIIPQGARTGMTGIYWRQGERREPVEPLEVLLH